MNNIKNCSVVEFNSFAVKEEGSIVLIFGVSLIVELYVVPIDKVSDSLVDSNISSILIMACSDEIRCLRAVSKNVLSLRKDLSDSFGAINQPLFSNTIFHSLVIFPININSV